MPEERTRPSAQVKTAESLAQSPVGAAPRPKRGRGFNAYRVQDDVAYLTLTNMRGDAVAETMVDIADLEQLKGFNMRWSLQNGGYAISYSTENGKSVANLLHRVLMSAPAGQQVDHINRDKLDNKKGNLRIVSGTENMRNRGVRKDSSVGVRGITFISERSKPYRAQLKQQRRNVYTSYHATLNIARITVGLARAEFWGKEAS